MSSTMGRDMTRRIIQSTSRVGCDKRARSTRGNSSSATCTIGDRRHSHHLYWEILVFLSSRLQGSSFGNRLGTTKGDRGGRSSINNVSSYNRFIYTRGATSRNRISSTMGLHGRRTRHGQPNGRTGFNFSFDYYRFLYRFGPPRGELWYFCGMSPGKAIGVRLARVDANSFTELYRIAGGALCFCSRVNLLGPVQITGGNCHFCSIVRYSGVTAVGVLRRLKTSLSRVRDFFEGSILIRRTRFV